MLMLREKFGSWRVRSIEMPPQNKLRNEEITATARVVLDLKRFEINHCWNSLGTKSARSRRHVCHS